MAGAAAPLRAVLAGVAAVDHHAHLLSREGFGLADLLSESIEAEQREQVHEHPSYLRALRALAGALRCEPTEAAIAEVRSTLGPDAYARELLAACRFDAMLVDDGFAVIGAVTFEEQSALAGCPVHRVIRIEAEAEAAAVGLPSWEEARERFRSSIADGLAAGAVAMKTIAAYRCGLDLPPPPAPDEAQDRYRAWAFRRGYLPPSAPPPDRPLTRLADPVLISCFLHDALAVAAEVRQVPLQVHTGFGDHDLLLPDADPSRFRWYFESRLAGTEAPVVFLHCYPFVREASYMAHVYAQAHVDLSFALTLAAHRGEEMVLDALDLAPATKLLFATDASRGPELFYLGAMWWRDALAGALGRLVDDGHLDEATALRWGELVLAGNARSLYGLGPHKELGRGGGRSRSGWLSSRSFSRGRCSRHRGSPAATVRSRGRSPRTRASVRSIAAPRCSSSRAARSWRCCSWAARRHSLVAGSRRPSERRVVCPFDDGSLPACGPVAIPA